MKSSEIFRRHHAEIRSIVASHRGTTAPVFGSVLDGTDQEGSDLDLVIDPTSETTLLDIARIKGTLKLLGVKVDVLTPKALPESFRNRVLAEAEPV